MQHYEQEANQSEHLAILQELIMALVLLHTGVIHWVLS